MPVNHVWGARSVDGENNQFSQYAQVFGKPVIRNSRVMAGRIFNEPYINNCTLVGESLIFNSPRLDNTVVIDTPVIAGKAYLDKCTVAGNAVVLDNVSARNCMIMGKARISGNAILENAAIGDEVIIKGTAHIKGLAGGVLEIEGYVFLDRGVWTRAPLHYVCHKSGLVVTESEGELVNINCTTNTAKKWLNGAGRRYGKMLGMTPEELDEVDHYTELIAKETGKCY